MIFLRIFKVVFITLITLLFLSSCQDDPTSLGKDLIGTDLDLRVIDSQEDSLSQTTSSFIADTVSFGSAARIVLGNVENRKSTMLIRFGLILPDSIRTSLEEDNLTILSAEASLRPIYIIGDEGSVVDFTVHKINSDWGSGGFNKDSLSMLDYDPDELTDSKEITDSLISFNVNNDIALEWLKALISDTLGTNNGMIFIPKTGYNKAYGFRAFPVIQNEDSPKIRYIVENENNNIDTLYSRVVFDVHVPEGTVGPVEEGKFQMTAGVGQRGKLFFDLSSIPVNANINRAELTLTVDSLSSLIGNVDTDSLRIRLFADSASNKINSDIRLQRINFDGVQFKGNIAELVQHVLLGTDNQGFQLVLGNENESLDRYVVYGSTYSDPALRPKLKVYYNLIR